MILRFKSEIYGLEANRSAVAHFEDKWGTELTIDVSPEWFNPLVTINTDPGLELLEVFKYIDEIFQPYKIEVIAILRKPRKEKPYIVL